MWPHQRLEERLVERLLERLEPRLQHVLNDFLASAGGHQLLAEAISDVVADFAVVPSDSVALSMAEQIVLSVSQRLANRPLFLQALRSIVEQQTNAS